MDAGGQTLLERLLAKQRQNPRRFQNPIAEGMRATVSPMDSLSSQAMMDEVQGSSVAAAPSSPFRLASTAPDHSEGGPFQTAQLRRSGGAPTPARTAGNCANGQCGVRSGLVNQGQPQIISERVTAINGVPVNPSEPVPAGKPAAPSGRPDMSPEGLFNQAQAYKQSAAANWIPGGGNIVDAANDSTFARILLPKAIERQQELEQLELARRAMAVTEAHHADEQKTQEVNRQNARALTAEAMSQSITDAVRGVGDYANDDVQGRAAVAASKEIAMMASKVPVDPAKSIELQKAAYDKYHAIATAHDLSHTIAGQMTVGPNGRPAYQRGNRESIDQLVNNRFFGRTIGDITKDSTDPNAGTVLTGQLLLNEMHRELDGPLATQLHRRFMEMSPGMKDEDARNLAMDEAHKIVGSYHSQVDTLNTVLATTKSPEKAWSVYSSITGYLGGSRKQAPQQSQPRTQYQQQAPAQQQPSPSVDQPTHGGMFSPQGTMSIAR